MLAWRKLPTGANGSVPRIIDRTQKTGQCPGDNFPRVVSTFLTLWATGEEGKAMNTFENHPGEKGDVPGWVLITLMTAGLVVVIWSAAGPALSGVFEQAITRVTGF